MTQRRYVFEQVGPWVRIEKPIRLAFRNLRGPRLWNVYAVALYLLVQAASLYSLQADDFRAAIAARSLASVGGLLLFDACMFAILAVYVLLLSRGTSIEVVDQDGIHHSLRLGITVKGRSTTWEDIRGVEIDPGSSVSYRTKHGPFTVGAGLDEMDLSRLYTAMLQRAKLMEECEPPRRNLAPSIVLGFIVMVTVAVGALILWVPSADQPLGSVLESPVDDPSALTPDEEVIIADFEYDAASVASDGSRRSLLPASTDKAIALTERKPDAKYDARTMREVLQENAEILVGVEDAVSAKLEKASETLPERTP